MLSRVISTAVMAFLLPCALVSCAQMSTPGVMPENPSVSLEEEKASLAFRSLNVPENRINRFDDDPPGEKDKKKRDKDTFALTSTWEIEGVEDIPESKQLSKVVKDNRSLFDGIDYLYMLEDNTEETNSVVFKVTIDNTEYALVMYGLKDRGKVQVSSLLMDFKQAEADNVFDRYQEV